MAVRTGNALRALAVAVLLLAVFRISVAIRADTPDHGEHAARYSLLALGDTGKRHRPFAHGFEPQLSVGSDLVAEDRAHPVDALLLLGDNFYMRGLREEELTERIRMNLVLPYCGFVSLTAPRSAEVWGVCAGQTRARGDAQRPIFALLGNHDHLSRESPALQRDAIPRYVANWSLTTDVVDLRTLAPGIDLIRLDVTRIEKAGMSSEHRDAVAAALQSSRGPWRVIASHAGVAVGDDGGVPSPESTRGRFAAFLRSAMAQAGVPVQLLLAGHHHTLQALRGEGAGDAALHVIAGSGSRVRPLRVAHPRALYARSRPGFARLDWTQADGADHVEVSLFASAMWPVLRTGAAHRVARFDVGLDGRVREAP